MTEITTQETTITTITRLTEAAKTNWRRTAIIGAVVLIVLAIASWLSYEKACQGEKASYALFTAQSQSPEAVDLVTRQYPATFAAAAALNTLAATAVHQTNYAASITYYRRLVAEHPASYLVPAANLAIAQCYLAQGSIEIVPAKRQELFAQAESVLKRDLLYNRDHYATLSAQLALVHVLEAQGRHGDAWNELRMWDQQVGNSEIAVLADGLRERLARITGAITNNVHSTATQ